MSSTTTTTTTTTVVEHVVLFKVKDSTDPTASDAMISRLTALISLPSVSHLSAAPILRSRSPSAAGFTHILHSRYPSKSALADYSAHPDHLSVVRESVLPIVDDIMAVDWVADLPPAVAALPPGSAVRVTFVKPKEGGDDEIVRVSGGIDVSGRPIEQVSFGRNFSPGRAKGFTVAFMSVFRGTEEMDAVEGMAEVEAVKERVRPLIEDLIIVDFVVPAAPASL
ncbi:hypothetical protein QJS10_CPB12g01758 [Acorus calamus]|uniref:Stress-response A/B barrel domain-containing protein n=1 Tax=Acorus calamus TaxID=4465 RepID=A0AAV9DPC0_ACOCL|nr:hypothetical protein QJS10_CPB12g01758 [Acorus calamus]